MLRFKSRLERETPQGLGVALTSAVQSGMLKESQADHLEAFPAQDLKASDEMFDAIGVDSSGLSTIAGDSMQATAKELLTPEAMQAAATWAYDKLSALDADLHSMLDEAMDLSAKKQLFDHILGDGNASGGSASSVPSLSGRELSSQELESIGASELHACAEQLKGVKLCWDAIVSLSAVYGKWADDAFDTFDFGTAMMTLKQNHAIVRALP